MKNKKNIPIEINIDPNILESEILKQQELSKVFWECTTPVDDDSFDIIKFLDKMKELEYKNEK